MRMKVWALLASVLVLATQLPAPSYALVAESIPFYVFDGVSYTRLFMLPATYFVAVEENGEDYTRVTYLDLSGYIRTGDASEVDYEPETKYATGGKVLFDRGVASVFLYADPVLSNVLTAVSVTDELFLYGEAGYENVYYCRAVTSSGTLRGYIGPDGVTVSLPPDNVIRPVDPPDDGSIDAGGELPPVTETTTLAIPVEVILSVSLAVPAFLLVFLLTRKK